MLKYLLLFLLPFTLNAQSTADKARSILQNALQVHQATRLYEFENTYIKKYPNEDSATTVSLCRIERVDTSLQFAFMAEQNKDNGNIAIYKNNEWRIHQRKGQSEFAYVSLKHASSAFNFGQLYFEPYAEPNNYFSYLVTKERHYQLADTLINKEKYHKVRVSLHNKFDLSKPAPDSVIIDLLIHAKNASIYKISSQYFVFGKWYYDSHQIKKARVNKALMEKYACKDCKVKNIIPPTANKDKKEPTIKLDANIALKNINKTTQTIASFEGKYKLIYFWYLSCAPCMLSKPAIHDLMTTYQAKGVTFIGINIDPESKIAAIEKNLKEHHLEEMHTFYEASQYADQAGIESYPSFVILDANNKIVHFQHGYSSELYKELSEKIDSLLKQ